jgi:hypothetical protein
MFDDARIILHQIFVQNYQLIKVISIIVLGLIVGALIFCIYCQVMIEKFDRKEDARILRERALEDRDRQREAIEMWSDIEFADKDG